MLTPEQTLKYFRSLDLEITDNYTFVHWEEGDVIARTVDLSNNAITQTRIKMVRHLTSEMNVPVDGSIEAEIESEFMRSEMSCIVGCVVAEAQAQGTMGGNIYVTSIRGVWPKDFRSCARGSFKIGIHAIEF
jgi:hypothetical protein